jgi:hypothetical protein
MIGQLSYTHGSAFAATLDNGDMGERFHAVRQFEAASANQWLRRLISGVLGRPHKLLSLEDHRAVSGRKSHLGLRTVSIKRILGSEGREQDFDAGFRPLQEHDRDRWVGVLLAMRRGETLPPVELIQVGDIYYVRDGHHRISAARQLGYREIEAVVTVWG